MGNFIVSARKYRPTTFDEVVGQDHISKTLKNALQTDHLAHAFLFTGPRGVGKTTCARILAKIINCENPVNKSEACNTCKSCLSFTESTSLNIYELDAASNNSVENMRGLIEQVRFQPQAGKYKVYIIDEVHMLTTAAFNAFLKTLEEPPSYAIFILATTEKHKIIPTILSRCQIFDFKRIQPSDTVLQLEKICTKEGITAEPEALYTIASKADGAMRDALSIFDKIISSTGDVITYKDVVANLNLLDTEYYFRVTDAFLRENIAEVLLILNEIIRDGFDPDHFVVGLADHFRDLMIAKIPETTHILDISNELKNRYAQQSAIATMTLLLSGLNILNQCDIDLVRAKNKRLHVELALSKITFINRASKVDFFGSSEVQEKKTEVLNKMPDPGNEKEPTPTLSPVQSQQPKATVSNDISPTVSEKPKTPIQATEPKTTIKVPNKMTDIDAIRQSIIDDEKMKAKARKNISIEQVKEIWESHAEHNPSKSVQSALHIAIIHLEEKVISAKVPTQVSKDLILQESILWDKLRNQLGMSDLVFDIEIDKSLFPDFEDNKPVQAMTQRERYILMLEKNPTLGSFTQKFGLKLDTDV
ncbi:MAG: DNA polymerase III subunit gamma/tau [Saprospiraceae bacterium]